MSKAPKLRFKEFSGDWQRTTLKQVTNSFEYGMNAAANEFDGKNKYIRITDIDENTSKYLNENVVSPLGELEEKYLVKENDILFARTGASTGKTYLYDSKDGKLYFAGFLIRANVNNDNNAKFIFLQTKTRAYDKWVKVMSMRSGQPGINSQEYASYSFYAPSKEEQEKIASFFSLIDDKISLQVEKVEALKDYKRGMMQKIFSRELRFKDDEGRDYPEWEEKKLGNLLKSVSSGKTKFKNEEGTYKVYGSMGVIGYTEEKDYEGEYILIARVGANAGTVNIINEPCGISDNTLAVKCNEEIDCNFLYYNLNQYNLSRLVFGSGQPLITGGQVKDIKIHLPCLEEQLKIARYLHIIDNKVQKEQEKLDSLNEYKKGLLQQMFV